jgi:sulfonate transport system ATP-binding protein
MAGTLDLRGVIKSYQVGRRNLLVLGGIDLKVAAGEFVSIVGPSGCGKSTLLRLAVGLDRDFRGDVLFDGERITGTSLDRGIVFQDPRLLPWLNLQDNIALGLENSNWPRDARNAAVKRHIELVGLAGFENVYPHQLSGGMAQRAAIARALVSRPEILLLDEPLGALDALTRMRLQDELLNIWNADQISMVLVTHDVEEAIYLANRVVVMHADPGRIVRDIEVRLRQPRDRASQPFGDLRREVLQALGGYPPGRSGPDKAAGIHHAA